MGSKSSHGHKGRYAKTCWICKMQRRSDQRLHGLFHNVEFFGFWGLISFIIIYGVFYR